MSNMLEIRFHGRGGQGAKSAGDVLAYAAFQNGKIIQAFPEYGSERKGAPVKSFVRISDKEIHIYSGITNPDIVIVLDATLIQSENVTEGLKEGGYLIINSPEPPEYFKNIIKRDDIKYFTVDANTISMNKLGRAYPNAPMLAAAVAATRILKVDEIIESFKNYFKKKLLDDILQKNLEVMQEAAKEVKGL